MSRKLKKLSALLIPLVMTACARGSTVPAVSDYCAIAKPISYDSKTDSAATITQIQIHNSQFVCVCEHDCPK